MFSESQFSYLWPSSTASSCFPERRKPNSDHCVSLLSICISAWVHCVSFPPAYVGGVLLLLSEAHSIFLPPYSEAHLFFPVPDGSTSSPFYHQHFLFHFFSRSIETCSSLIHTEKINPSLSFMSLTQYFCLSPSLHRPIPTRTICPFCLLPHFLGNSGTTGFWLITPSWSQETFTFPNLRTLSVVSSFLTWLCGFGMTDCSCLHAYLLWHHSSLGFLPSLLIAHPPLLPVYMSALTQVTSLETSCWDDLTTS